MVDLNTGEIVREGKVTPVVNWQVWFRTPFGLVTTLDEAVSICKQTDVMPNLCIQPVCVALDDAGRHEEVHR